MKDDQTALAKKLSGIGNKKVCPHAVVFRDWKILLGLWNYTPDK